MSVIKFVTKADVNNTSTQVLQECIDMRPETVIVFAFDGSRVHIKTSSLKSNLELIGALDAAKMQIWGNA